MFSAQVVSMVGDQVAAVSLAVLLYARSHSAFVAGLGYATVYLPWLVGGPLLAAWAERLPPRRVLVGCDLGRAALIGLAAVPGVPLPVLGALVFLAAMLAPPFEATSSALLPQVLVGDRYAVGASAIHALHQAAQLVGFVAGGAAVLVLGANTALLLNAGSFAVSAVFLHRGLTSRPAVAGTGRNRLIRETLDGLLIVARDRRLSGPLLLGIVGAAYLVVPEAVAAPYAASLGAGAGGVGMIMAAAAGGSVLGAVVLGRLVPPLLRRRLMWPLALAGCLPLVLVVSRPGLGVTLVLLAVAGAAGAFQVTANTSFATAAPPEGRARAVSFAMAGMCAGQSLAIVLAGAVATVIPPTEVVAGAAVLGAVTMVMLRPLVGSAPEPRPVSWSAPGRAALDPA